MRLRYRHAAQFILLLLGALPAAAQIPEVRLEKRWEVHLGSTEEATYRTAVCSNGTAHLISSNGRLISVDSTGRVLRNVSHQTLLGARLATCDSDGALYVVAVARPAIKLIRLSASAGGHLEEAPLPFPVAGLTFAPGHGLLALSPGDDGFLCWLSPGGRASPRFGDIGGPNTAPASLSSASVVWDETNARILTFLSYAYEVHQYSPAGKFLGRKARRGIELRPRKRDDAGRLMHRGDRILGAVILPSGEAVVQVARAERNGTFLDLVDAELEHGIRIPLGIDGVSGFLQGTDREGTLFFQKIQSPGPASIGVNLVRASIVRP